MTIYPGTAMRSASATTRSMSPQHGHAGPPAAHGSHLLDATKIGSNSQNGPGRRYHCKICSQVSDHNPFAMCLVKYDHLLGGIATHNPFFITNPTHNAFIKLEIINRNITQKPRACI